MRFVESSASGAGARAGMAVSVVLHAAVIAAAARRRPRRAAAPTRAVRRPRAEPLPPAPTAPATRRPSGATARRRTAAAPQRAEHPDA